MNEIICRNCKIRSWQNYYGFCSISCFADFAVVTGLTDSEVISLDLAEQELNRQQIIHNEEVGRLNAEIAELERDIATRDHKEHMTNEAHTAAIQQRNNKIAALTRENEQMIEQIRELQSDNKQMELALQQMRKLSRFRDMEI